MSLHLDMEQLLAVRDGDRSEPRYADAHRHASECAACQAELELLHQRTARLRALATLAPAHNQFPAISERVRVARQHRQRRVAALAGLGLAAGLGLTVIGRDLVRPTRLDAEQELQSAISNSQQLEQTLHEYHPEARVVDGRTAIIVIQLENRIADLDAQLASTSRLDPDARVGQALKLWRQRVGLMNALVDVHLTNASNVDM